MISTKNTGTEVQHENTELGKVETNPTEESADISLQNTNIENAPITTTTVVHQNERNNMRPFTGALDANENFDQWIQKFEDLMETKQITEDAAKVANLKWLLEGNARKHYDTLSTAEIATYNDVKNAMKQQYQNEWYAELAKEQLNTCYQQTNERVSAYIERLKKAIRQAYPGENENTIAQHTYEHFKNKSVYHFA